MDRLVSRVRRVPPLDPEVLLRRALPDQRSVPGHMPPREATRQGRQDSALVSVDALTCGRAKDVQFLILAAVASLVSGAVFV
jgi:hypothetical protein